MDALLWLTPVILFSLYWFDTAAAKEQAVIYGKKACKDIGVQFLDESVVRYHTRIQRGQRGNLCFSRAFRFEFTINGQIRHEGYLRLLGKRLQLLDMDLPDEESQSHSKHLILDTPYSKETNVYALRQRSQERSNCRD